MNQFKPASAYELRAQLHKQLREVEELAQCAAGCLDRREFASSSLPWCINQMVLKAQKAQKFYRKNR